MSGWSSLRCKEKLRIQSNCCIYLGWNELLVAAISHRSIVVRDGLLLSTGVHVNRSTAYQNGVGPLFDRVMTELVGKMRDLRMDRVELACIRAIILFNPG